MYAVTANVATPIITVMRSITMVGDPIGRVAAGNVRSLALPAAIGGFPKRLSVEILQRFPTTQRTQPGAVQPHVFLYFSAVSPGVLT